MSAIVGETLIFGQQNGPELELLVYGDEFYARYETLNGYTVLYDLDYGIYCYAVVQDGRFVSTGIPVSKAVPAGIKKHIKESAVVHNQKFAAKYKMIRPEGEPLSADSNIMRTYGPNSGLLNGRQVSMGDVKGLTILVEFADVKAGVSKEDVDALLNKPDYNGNGNFCSLNKYFRLMSDGKLNYTNRVVGPVTLSRKQSYYINNLLNREALELAIEQYNLDLSEFDSRQEGVVDALSFMYAGRSLYAGKLWPHNHTKYLRFGNYRTYLYTIQSLGRSRVDLSIGTFAHESGHMLCRFPDLYDYGQRDGDFEKSSGMGQYCLMSSGNHLGYGKRPAPVCAYLRDLAGWCDEEILLNNPGIYELQHGDYGKIYRFVTDKPHEYFIVENRVKKDLDAYLPDSGLAVYHCDTRGSNEYQDGTPDKHYQCALLQADGHKDLETGTAGGDSGDLYSDVNGVAISDSTNPSSCEWDGTDSGLLISDIKETGDDFTFKAGPDVIVAENVVNKAVVADLLIPENNVGVDSVLNIERSGILESIKVGVHITHPYRGDLHVSLESPSGKVVLLHKQEGAHLDNLILDLSSDEFEELANFKEEEISGEWKLNVKDLLKEDKGRLDSWNISIAYKDSDALVTGEANPELAIPDYNSKGIESEITLSDSGSLKQIAVQVDIEHTYNGDLQIELLAPSGATALLRAATNIRGKNLQETYTEATTNSLQAFIGEGITGAWKLKVRDLAKYDTGVLKYWALTIKK